MKLDYWVNLIQETTSDEKFLLSKDQKLIGYIDIDRKMFEDGCKDPLSGVLPPYGEVPYGPTVWGPEAYAKSFEKFFYAEPCKDIRNKFPREWEFAKWALYQEYGYLQDTPMIPITATSKNTDSTTAVPKCMWYNTERDLLEDRGFQDYIDAYNDLLSGDRPPILWYMFLKNEIIKKSKIQEQDIRQIVCADPIFARIGCMFEEPQNDEMKKMTQWTQAQCGWSPFEGGFNQVISRLEKEGSKYIEFDWTRFDGTIPVEVFLEIKFFRFGLLPREQRTKQNLGIYSWYVENLMNRIVVLPSGEVTTQTRGNPSGQISTTTDNNMVNTFLQAFEYAYLRPSLTHHELIDQWNDYDTLVYGDDRLTRTPNLPENYVEKVIEMYRDVFGMWVKPDKVIVSDTLEGLSFCGFTIIKECGLYVPIPSNPEKFIASAITPSKKMPSLEALYGKLLSFKILLHNLDKEHPVRSWVEKAMHHIRELEELDPTKLPVFTDELCDILWRGGPK